MSEIFNTKKRYKNMNDKRFLFAAEKWFLLWDIYEIIKTLREDFDVELSMFLLEKLEEYKRKE